MATTKQPELEPTQNVSIMEALMKGYKPKTPDFYRYIGLSAEQQGKTSTRNMSPGQRFYKFLVGLDDDEREILQSQQLADATATTLAPKLAEFQMKQAEAKANRIDPRQLQFPAQPGQPAIPPSPAQPGNLADFMQPRMNADVVLPSGRAPLDMSQGSRILTDKGRGLLDAVDQARTDMEQGKTLRFRGQDIPMASTNALRYKHALERLTESPHEELITETYGAPTELRSSRNLSLPPPQMGDLKIGRPDVLSTYIPPVPEPPGRPAIPPQPARVKTPQEWMSTSGPVTPEQLEQIMKVLPVKAKPKVTAHGVPAGGRLAMVDEQGNVVGTIEGGDPIRNLDFGNMREAKSFELYNKSYAHLTQSERAEVQKQTKADQARERAEAAALVGIAVNESKQGYRLGEKHDNWINVETLTSAKPNQTLDDMAQGYIHIDEQRKPAMMQIRTLVNGLKTLEDVANRLLRNRTGYTLWDAPTGVVQSLVLSTKELAGDPDAQLLNSVITRITVPQAKLQGDAANVAVAEREMLGKSMLDKNDTVESMRAKINDIKYAMESILLGMGFPEKTIANLEGQFKKPTIQPGKKEGNKSVDELRKDLGLPPLKEKP